MRATCATVNFTGHTFVGRDDNAARDSNHDGHAYTHADDDANAHRRPIAHTGYARDVRRSLRYDHGIGRDTDVSTHQHTAPTAHTDWSWSQREGRAADRVVQFGWHCRPD